MTNLNPVVTNLNLSQQYEKETEMQVKKWKFWFSKVKCYWQVRLLNINSYQQQIHWTIEY